MKTILLLLALVASGPTITDVGYCPDVMSPACPVSDYWPRSLRAQSVGAEAYYFVSGRLNDLNDARVAFVSRKVYAAYFIGMSAPEGLIWRIRQP